MSFTFKIEGVAEAINYVTNTVPALANQAALFAVQNAAQPYQPDYIALLQNLPVKHVEKQMRHRQSPPTPLYLHNGVRTRMRHLWQDILFKSGYYKDGRGAYALTGASDADQTPLERFVESGSDGQVRYRKTMGDAPTGIMPTYKIAEQVLRNNQAIVEAKKLELFEQKLLELRRSAGEQVGSV